MDIQTEQLLGTLEVLLDKELDLFLPCHENGAKLKPFVWDTNIQGAFTPLNLIQSEGWMTQTDIELAFSSWQWSEDTCLAAKGIFNDCSDYLDDRDDENIVLDNETKIDRIKKYQVLRNAIEVNIPCIQAFTLSCNSGYSLSIIVGQITEHEWICLSPTVPQETQCYINKTPSPNNDRIKGLITGPKVYNISRVGFAIETQIKTALKKLGSIQVYGWYHGGYNHLHDYKIVYTVGESFEQVVENALKIAGLIEIYDFDSFAIGEQIVAYSEDEAKEVEERFQHINVFLNQSFLQLKLYRFCFWDYENIYIIGESKSQDFVGISIKSQFVYNP